MVLERGEVDQVPVQDEGRHPVLDCLLRFRSRLPDGFPNLLQALLDILWKTRDVVVDVLGL